MSIEHLDFDAVSAYADGDLGDAAALHAERHLAACADCRRRLQGVRTLVASAAALPRDVDPPGEVWDGIVESMRRRPRSAWRTRVVVGVAAAAILIVAGSMWQRPGRSAKTMAPVARATPPALVAVDRNYQRSIDELRRTLEQQGPALSPATVRVLERSLAVIDAAIAEARAALASDPANEVLTGILAAQYQNKVELLQRATQLSPAT